MDVLLPALIGAAGVLLLYLSWNPAVSAQGEDPYRPEASPSPRGAGGGTRKQRALGPVALAGAGLVFLLVLGGTSSPPVAAAFGILAGWLLLSLARSRQRAEEAARRESWPDLLDNLVSAVQAGVGLPEALAEGARTGPPPFRELLTEYWAEYTATGSFRQALEVLREKLADPTGDLLAEVLLTAREMGGEDVGTVLKTLASFARQEHLLRRELEARQSWTITSARLAAAAPWVTLGLLSLRPEAARAYASPAGAFVIAAGTLATLLGYRLMLRLARLPERRRVMAGRE